MRFAPLPLLTSVGALANPLARGGRFLDQLAGIDGGQLAVPLEQAAVDQDGVDIRGLPIG
jgi:hypothetical protein